MTIDPDEHSQLYRFDGAIGVAGFSPLIAEGRFEDLATLIRNTVTVDPWRYTIVLLEAGEIMGGDKALGWLATR